MCVTTSPQARSGTLGKCPAAFSQLKPFDKQYSLVIKSTSCMSDQGPSIADIQAARNQKLAAESSTDSIARELEGAHQEALALKQRLRDQGEEPGQQQVR